MILQEEMEKILFPNFYAINFLIGFIISKDLAKLKI